MTGRYRPLLACALLLSALATAAAQPSFNTLQPGQFREIEQNLRINIVFVGYRTFGNVNTAFLLANLPKTYRAVNRFPSLTTGQLEFTGNKFNFSYNIVNSTQGFDNAYFAYLNSIAVAAPRTIYQDLYNQEPARRRTVGQNYQIDSVRAERWLAENAETMLGVNTRQPTVFFVNWFGPSDFKFHVYARVGQHDPDTGGTVGLLDFAQEIRAAAPRRTIRRHPWEASEECGFTIWQRARTTTAAAGTCRSKTWMATVPPTGESHPSGSTAT